MTGAHGQQAKRACSGVRSPRMRQRVRRGLGRLRRRQGNWNKGRRASGDGRFLGRPRRRFQPQHVDFCQHRRASHVRSRQWAQCSYASVMDITKGREIALTDGQPRGKAALAGGDDEWRPARRDEWCIENSRVRRSVHHAIIPSHYLRSHGGGFAGLTFPFFRADQLSAILLSGLTIRVIVVRLGDDGSRGQHDPNNRANDCVPHVVNCSCVLCPRCCQALSVVADCSMMVLCNAE
jgi:hypothetical protein